MSRGKRYHLCGFSRAALLPVLIWALSSCGFFTPLPAPKDTAQRLAMFPQQNLPIKHGVTIHWHELQVPVIVAESDEDAAFTLGLVHAHLRLGQLELLRRVSQGRISEMAGPFTVDLDHALRILGLGRAAAEMVAMLPTETRSWLESFVAGLNYYATSSSELPYEFKALGLQREPWTVRDLMILERLYAADVNWFIFLRFLSLSNEDGWEELWRDYVALGADYLPSFTTAAGPDGLSSLLAALSRSGSNALVIGAKRSLSGSAMVASDPHVGLNYPNLWLLAGIHSPSYQTVGLMLPGMPFVALGRNPDMAWGGTNLRGLSSSIYDLAAVADSEFKTHTEVIKVRGWFDRKVEIRHSAWGPLLSDAPYFKKMGLRPFALKWVGHQASDEISAFLALNRARSWEEFQSAFSRYAVSSQNMLYADTAGNIGQLAAMRRPWHQSAAEPKLFLDPHDPADAWSAYLNPADFPRAFNPPEAFIASANNLPFESPYPLGYFFSSNSRWQRLSDLSRAVDKLSLNNLFDLQQDLCSYESRDLLNVIKQRSPNFGEQLDPNEAALWRQLTGWDACYQADSLLPTLFETLAAELAHLVFNSSYQTPKIDQAAGNSSYWKIFLTKQLKDLPDDRYQSLIKEALLRSSRPPSKLQPWGEQHRVRVAHFLSRAPFFSRRFIAAELPGAGTSDSLLKTAHNPSTKPHFATYGSVARHVSDLSDPDLNFFVLLGSQDGRLQRGLSLDQLPLWQRGEYIQIPLRVESLDANFANILNLSPRAAE